MAEKLCQKLGGGSTDLAYYFAGIESNNLRFYQKKGKSITLLLTTNPFQDNRGLTYEDENIKLYWDGSNNYEITNYIACNVGMYELEANHITYCQYGSVVGKTFAFVF